MRQVRLVAFENDSVLNQKALSLPMGKISIRQLGILVIGLLGTFFVYSISNNFFAAGGFFVVFLALGMINTKVQSPDQMLKSVIMLMVRGTSLSTKPQYMIDDEKKRKQQKMNNVTDQKNKNNNNSLDQMLSQITSMFKKNNSDKTTNKEKHIDVKLTSENILHIIKPSTKPNKDSVDKLLDSLTRGKQIKSSFEDVTILLDNNTL